ncbi:hypothetical protein KM043_015914 [Ampulex compressa]|nr:hypothetical protein KM043_015914 [Ampulex compressa]
MSKMADTTIPVFDGEDYGSWKKRITMFLKMKKCDVVITREKINTDKEDDWLEKDLRAINYIYGAISNKQLEFVQDKETAFEIIKKFDELYLKESTALQIICRNRLEKLRLNNYSDTAEFFSEFERSVNELKAAGAKVTEEEKMNYMLRTLPETYSYIGDLVDVLKEEDQTVHYNQNLIEIGRIKLATFAGRLDISRETVAKPERVAEAPGSIAGTKEEREVEADIVKVLKDEVTTKPSIGREDEINSGAVTELLV